MGSLEGCWRPGPSLLALASAGCEVLGESVPFGKALDNVDKVNAYGCFFAGKVWACLRDAPKSQHRSVYRRLQNVFYYLVLLDCL